MSKLGSLVVLNGSLVPVHKPVETRISLGHRKLPVDCVCLLPRQAHLCVFLADWRWVNQEGKWTGDAGFLHL